tara:strand:- start:3399 stop:3851 length:453 start_codon:yes stop_codon:yes gene_type:complete
MVLSLGDNKSLEDLYQTKILEFAREARKIQLLSNHDVRFVSKNPLCGDEVTIDLVIDDKRKISSYGHQVRGCSICEASSGLLSKNVIGLNIDNTEQLREKLVSWLNNESVDVPFLEIENLVPVKNFKNRYKCVSLSFDALSGACSKYKQD